jgi:hypothetical protein
MAVNPVDRSYVLVWEGTGLMPGETDIYARRFDEHGAALGSEFRANTFLPGDQTLPKVAMDYAGNFVVVWDTTIPLATGHVVYGRRFAADGTPIDDEQFGVYVEPRSAPTFPSVAMDADGDFVVAWQAAISPENYDVYARQFTTNGALASHFVVNSESLDGMQWQPSIAMDSEGNFLVTWNSANGAIREVKARWFTADGIADPAFRVRAATLEELDHASVAMNPHGEFVIAWQSGVPFQLYREDFDSYSDSSELNGQGGWLPQEPFDNLVLGKPAANGMSGIVVDGFTLPDGYGLKPVSVYHPIDLLTSSGMVQLSFKALARSGSRTPANPTSLYAGVALTDPAGSIAPMGWFVENPLNPGDVVNEWVFRVPTESGHTDIRTHSDLGVLGGIDEVVEMGIIIDQKSSTVVGTFDFGSGPGSTPPVKVSESDLDAHAGISIFRA